MVPHLLFLFPLNAERHGLCRIRPDEAIAIVELNPLAAFGAAPFRFENQVGRFKRLDVSHNCRFRQTITGQLNQRHAGGVPILGAVSETHPLKQCRGTKRDDPAIGQFIRVFHQRAHIGTVEWICGGVFSFNGGQHSMALR